MFTGLIRARSIIRSRSTGRKDSLLLVLERPEAWDEIRLGDSIAVHGTCLTVTALSDDSMSFEATAETRARCRFDQIPIGAMLHVEPAMRLSDRLDGHLLTGHVDGLATLTKIENVEGGQRMSFSPSDKELLPLLAPRGSVALDGVSLTIVDCGQDAFDVVLVPETLEATELGRLSPGGLVHVEVDLLARYVAHHLGSTGGGASTHNAND